MIKYEDLKCEFCDGQGEKEKNIDGMDCPVTCTFCEGSGIDHDQLKQISPIPELKECLVGFLRLKDILGADDEYYNKPEHQGEGEAINNAFNKAEIILSILSKLKYL